MTNDETRELAIKVLQADSQERVIALLKAARLWDAPDAWRFYGDRDGNYSTIGNQQASPESALVEKIVNAVDARLMNECLKRGIDPASDAAPKSIREAVRQFIEGKATGADIGGTVQTWDGERQREEAKHITMAMTGYSPKQGSGRPCITIADTGEGQTPSRMPDTFLSIEKNNKLRIHFVQGKFNMGGTGALKFCGDDGLQFIISKRNPEILTPADRADPTAGCWSFTIVRRERPQKGIRNSVFTYLAPVGRDKTPGRGALLTFRADHLALMPEGRKPYVREISSGSAVKLYEYDLLRRYRSNALMAGGLAGRLQLLLPGIALPVRIHECREYKGDPGRSFENSMVGLMARLERHREEYLEQEFPFSVPISVRGHEMVAQIFAFKTTPERSKPAESYRDNEGVIFVINGQTHAHLPTTFFQRKKVAMSRLADSLLIIVDCSKFAHDAVEDLFMNSRDRLSNGELRKAIEEELEDQIGTHHALRALRAKRQQQEISNRLDDAKPLEDVLSAILKSSPALSRLFLAGQRLSRPHPHGGTNGHTGGRGPNGGGGTFEGRKHPTYFRFPKVPPGQTLVRTFEIGRRCRVKFETDVENEYFSRPAVPGHYVVEVLEGPLEGNDLSHGLNVVDGVGNWSITLPEDKLSPGDELTVQCTVTDDVIQEPFVSLVKLRATAMAAHPPGPPTGRPRNGGSEKPGGTGSGSSGSSGSGGPDKPEGIKFPRIEQVKEGDQFWVNHSFNEQTALKVIDDGTSAEDGSGPSEYTFYVNVDNLFLRTDMKASDDDPAVKRAKFVYGNVLVGLALINEWRAQNGSAKKHVSSDKNSEANGNGEESDMNIEAVVERTTRALAPFLVPMIDHLGSLTPEGVHELAQAGDND